MSTWRLIDSNTSLRDREEYGDLVFNAKVRCVAGAVRGNCEDIEADTWLVDADVENFENLTAALSRGGLPTREAATIEAERWIAAMCQLLAPVKP